MRIESGHSASKDVVAHDFKRVRFVADDGRTMFEVVAGSDGRSIEVRGVDSCKVDGVLYHAFIALLPNAGNSVTIRTLEWEKPRG